MNLQRVLPVVLWSLFLVSHLCDALPNWWPSRQRRAGRIQALQLVSAPSGIFVANLTNGTVVFVNSTTTPGLTVVAVPDTTRGRIRSVAFDWNTKNHYRTEQTAPYTLCGGKSYDACSDLQPGVHTIAATVKGGSAYRVSFTLVDRAPVPTLPTVSPPSMAPKGKEPPIKTPVGTPTHVPVVSPTPNPASIPTNVNVPVLVAPTAGGSVPVPDAPVLAPMMSSTTAAPKAPILNPASIPTNVNVPVLVAPTTGGSVPLPNAPVRAPMIPSTTTAPAAATKILTKAPTQTPLRTPIVAPKTPTRAPTIPTLAANLTLVDFSYGGSIDTLLVNNGVMEFKLERFYTVQAKFANSLVKSVQFVYDSRVVRIENEPPFVLAGKTGNELSPWLPTQGGHSLVATAYSLKNATGVVLASLTASFVARLAKDTVNPEILKLKGPEQVIALSPPSSLEVLVETQDVSSDGGTVSGIARITVFLSTYLGYENYTDHSSVTKRFDEGSYSIHGKPLATKLTLPYPRNLAPGKYYYRAEVEDFAGNVQNEYYIPSLGDVKDELLVTKRRIELLNVTTYQLSPTNANALTEMQIQSVQVTLKDDEYQFICVSASRNGYSTDESCKTFPSNRDRVPGQPVVMDLALDVPFYFPTGVYSLNVFSTDAFFDSAYLASKGFVSVINIVNPNVGTDWKPPQVMSLTALTPTSIDLSTTGTAIVTVRLVIQETAPSFDEGEIQFWLNNRIAATVSADSGETSREAGQPWAFQVDLPILERAGAYPVSLVFKDRFLNMANVSVASLAQLGFPVVVQVKGLMTPPLSDLESFLNWLTMSDISFGYGRVVIWADFGTEMGYFKGGSMSLSATGVSDSNRGAVLHAREDCYARPGGKYPFPYCFFLDETTPLGLYLMTADVRNGFLYDAAALSARGFDSNFTVTSRVTTGLGP
jgi:hypothetical protein